MALILSKDLDTGITGNYWRITQLQYDIERNITRVWLSLYKDEATRLAEKLPLTRTVFEYAGVNNPIDNTKLKTTDPLELCYVAIKAEPEFSASTDK